jgi:hypothetical protein
VAAALVASAAANASDPKTYQTYAAAFVLMVGLVYLAAGLPRLGFIKQFLSKPVMDGFVVGLAVFVAVGQLYKRGGQRGECATRRQKADVPTYGVNRASSCPISSSISAFSFWFMDDSNSSLYLGLAGSARLSISSGSTNRS